MKKIVAMGLTALLCQFASAGEGYMGADFGRGKISDPSASGTSWNLYGGYRLNANVGFEAGYRQVFKDTINVLGTDVSTTVSAVQASAVGFLPLNADVDVFARLGVNRLRAKASVGAVSASDSETKALIGLGMDYRVSKQVSVRMELQKPASDVTVFALGVKFGF